MNTTIKRLGALFLALALALSMTSTATATTPTTITADGALGDWESDEHLGTVSTVAYYVTWDATYLYVGFNGGSSTTYYDVAIDTDPGDKGTSNSGTTDSLEGATFITNGKPDFAFSRVGSTHAAYNVDSEDWATYNPDNDASAGATCDTTSYCVEFVIPWAAVNFTPGASISIGLYLFTGDGSNISSAWPPSNRQSGSGLLTTRLLFHHTSSGVVPRTAGTHHGEETFLTAGPEEETFSLLNGFVQVHVDAYDGSACQFSASMVGNQVYITDAVKRTYFLTVDGSCDLDFQADITLKYIDAGTESYSAPSELNGLTEANLELWSLGTGWANNGAEGRDPNANTVTVNNILDFSTWVFRTSSSEPTAIKLVSLEAHPQVGQPVALIVVGVAALGLGGLLLARRLRKV
ncbi:MAG: hypothetical protein JW726_00190 [Anaerolineales bacterium]|nr:hypothetical protein [Anaerolineales bacterium]